MKKGGFTLIELLVVIAIIAILAGMLLTALSGARERGRQAVCISNLKQLNMALRMYADNNNNYYPMGTDPNLWTNGNPKNEFVNLLSPYVSQRGVFYCASVLKSVAADPTIANTDANWAAGNIAYYYWSFLKASANTINFNTKVRILRDPMLRAEKVWVMSDWFKMGAPFPHGTHANLLVVSYLDGHVESATHGRPIDLFR